MTAPQNLESLVQQYWWYHTIDLGDGLYTPGKRSLQHLNDKLIMMKLPKDLGGCSVLDIGRNEGFFSIEAQRRGASRVVRVDNQQRKEVAAKFALAKTALSHDVELRLEDVHDLNPEVIGHFDLVLFLSVFHHLRHPFLASGQGCLSHRQAGDHGVRCHRHTLRGRGRSPGAGIRPQGQNQTVPQ